MEVTQPVPFERTQARVGAQIVAALAPQIKQDGVDVVRAMPQGARKSHSRERWMRVFRQQVKR